MPGKRDSNVSDLTVEILREIRDEARKTNTRLDGLTERVDGLQLEVRQGFELVGRRIDNLLLGEHRQEHEELRGRVERIEQHLGLRSQ